jgi:GH25 family lysozyme M1 (1,4-beta-N-acetylmuramidase)
MDMSDYQATVDFKKLKEEGLSLVIAKCSSGTYDAITKAGREATFSDKVQQCYNENLPVMAYHWLDPIPYFTKYGINNLPPKEKDEQVHNLAYCLKNKQVYGIMINIEQWWADWGKYYQYLRREIPVDQVPVVPEAWVRATANTFINNVCDTFPEFAGRIIIYSANWFVERYPSLRQTLDGYPSICANYPTEHLPSGLINLKNIQDLRMNYMPTDADKPLPFNASGTATMWQFSGDKMTLPYILGATGKVSALDWILFKGTEEELYKWIQFTDPERPPIEPPIEPPTEPPVEPPTGIDEKLDLIIAKLNKIDAWIKRY